MSLIIRDSISIDSDTKYITIYNFYRTAIIVREYDSVRHGGVVSMHILTRYCSFLEFAVLETFVWILSCK